MKVVKNKKKTTEANKKKKPDFSVKRDKNAKSSNIDTTLRDTFAEKRMEQAKILKEWADLQTKMTEKQKALLRLKNINAINDDMLIFSPLNGYMDFVKIRQQCEAYLKDYDSFFKNPVALSYLEEMKDTAIILASVLFSDQFFYSEDKAVSAMIEEQILTE